MVAPRATVIGKRSFPKRGTKCPDEKTTVSRLSGRLLDTGDTSTVTAVCGFHLADRISQDSMTLYSVMFIVLNQQNLFAENPLPFPSPVCYGPHRTNHVVLVSSLVVFSSQHFVPRFGKLRFPITVALRATIVGLSFQPKGN